MKVALVHDYIKEYGGAERVLEVLHEMYPDAPIYTSVYLPSFLGPHKSRFETWDIRASWANNLPFRHKFISPLRLISPFLFRSFDFTKYDVVISSATGAYFPNSLKKKKAILICYCHTPPRYLYGYATAREWGRSRMLKVVVGVMNHLLRIVDYTASQNVDQYIANSDEVRKRIEKFYRKKAEVIYPPVSTMSKHGFQNSKSKPLRSYFLAGGRLAQAKHTDLIIKACMDLNVPLKVFGKGFAGYDEELRSLVESRKSKVELLGEVTDEEKEVLLQDAKAYLFASADEDFGILPVEAMAVGTPVIAYRSGGVKETIIDKKTGLFYEELTVDSLKDAVKRFSGFVFDEAECRKQAEKFSKERFIHGLEKVVEKRC